MPASEQVSHRWLQPDLTRQPMYAYTARYQPTAWFRQTKLGMFGRNDDVAGQRKFQTPAQSETVHLRDDRFREMPA